MGWIVKHWRTMVVWALLGVIAVGKPVSASLQTSFPSKARDGQTTQVVAEAGRGANQKIASAQLTEDAFARQLDTLTKYYEHLINLLLFVIASVGAFAFYTIRFVSRKEAEKIAEEVIASEAFREKLAGMVSRVIESENGDYKATLEEIQGFYEALDDIVTRRKQQE